MAQEHENERRAREGSAANKAQSSSRKQAVEGPPAERAKVPAARAKRNALALAKDAVLGDEDAVRALENLGTRTRALLDKDVNVIIDDAIKLAKDKKGKK